MIYDPELTVSLPPSYSGPSGMNAIAHAVEALYGEHANPITSLIAEEGIRALGIGLPKVCAEPGDLDGRTHALYGSWLCGIALGAGGMALHHKLCHVVGGSFGLAHAPTHTVILPHAMAYNAPAAEAAMARVCRALGAANAPRAVYDLIGAIGAPRGAEGHRHARGRPRPRRRPGGAQSVLQSARDHPRRYPQSAGRRLSRAPAGRLSNPNPHYASRQEETRDE